MFFVQTNHTRKELLFLIFKEINLRNHSSLHKLFYSLYYPSPNIKEFVSTNLKMQQKLNLEKTLRAIVSEKEEQMNKGDD